jgi:hypothetical protein
MHENKVKDLIFGLHVRVLVHIAKSSARSFFLLIIGAPNFFYYYKNSSAIILHFLRARTCVSARARSRRGATRIAGVLLSDDVSKIDLIKSEPVIMRG